MEKKDNEKRKIIRDRKQRTMRDWEGGTKDIEWKKKKETGYEMNQGIKEQQ